MSDVQEPLRTAVIGSGRMGRRHADVIAADPSYELIGACDLVEEAARGLAEEHTDVAVYTDAAQMLQTERPDVVVVATAGATHGPLVEMAAGAGARGVCCEKPMAVSLDEARSMVEACRRSGTRLILNHQRRMSAAMVAMRRLIEEGAIGRPLLVRANSPGDILSDGTHAVDSVRCLAGDDEVVWVLGQIYRDPPDRSEPRSESTRPSGGYRYGYPVESGGVGIFEFASGLRAEVFCGGMRLPGRAYQDYEAVGTEGRLRRAGDQADPPLQIWDGQAGGWREAPVGDAGDQFAPMAASYRAFARTILEGADHPLSGDSALKGHEVLMAIHESARTHRRIELPLEQGEYPLQLMIEAGQL